MATSAKGLFRATRPKLVETPISLPMDAPCEIPEPEALPRREKHDFSPTPPEPVMAFCAAERDRLSGFPWIWEPAAGDGRMGRALRACGHRVVMSDIVDRGAGASVRDFFAYRGAPNFARAIVTNPPYDKINWRDGKGAWLTHAVEALRMDYVALLLSWNWPGAGGLAHVYDRLPPARVYLCRWKIDFTGGGAPPMLNAWFVWDRQHHGPTQLLMLDRLDSRQGELWGA